MAKLLERIWRMKKNGDLLCVEFEGYEESHMIDGYGNEVTMGAKPGRLISEPYFIWYPKQQPTETVEVCYG